MSSLRVGSLFSGAGLCDLGLSWAGMKHEWFCEIDPFCQSVLSRHWPEVPIFGDVQKLEGEALPDVDILCGGFPCQDVSQGGNRAGIKTGTRSGLWLEYARIIREIRPKYAIIENVRGLLSCGIEIVLQDLAAIGYDAEWEVLPAAALGAPHHRERVFIVAYPNRGDGNRRDRLLAPLPAYLGEYDKPFQCLAWAGIRIERTSRKAIREAYRGPVLYRVDDGRSERLDLPAGVGLVPRAEIPLWVKRLKALGNAITPQQSYAIARCILEAEGIAVPEPPPSEGR